MYLIVALLLAYFIGSIPFGLLLTKFFLAQDIRDVGSGNVGATNVLRTGNKQLALATLLLDAGKGTFAVYCLSHPSFPDFAPYLIAASTLFGHLFPVWLRFRGGKGVATSFGVLLGLSWPVACLALMVWIVVALIFRYSALAALVATASAPAFAYFIEGWALVIFLLFTGIFVYMAHKENIQRLLAGKESKIGGNKRS